ncbi:glycosyltransferase family 2 protein [uncultured Pseudoteredinibacter sp.]|uniref:glycosyltransferase family 2 protein n=1 Tax=uncultured Pseudoteredinibacter sp. TaxID=1641701 RepID=UPI0026311E16|nr:glycosyltransferase family 2 protein [uncultured Pseudoteredinibacter sp.]
MNNGVNIFPVQQSIKISIIVPCFNESEVLPEFHRRLTDVRNGLVRRCEIIYVDDGSRDDTFKIIDDFCVEHDVVGVRLSRNFGKEAAMCAGLDVAKGEAVIFIDADLQDPPELVPEMISAWERGYDIVNMKRSSRRGDGFFKRYTAMCFYWLVSKLNARLHYPSEVSDFRLIGKEALAAYRELRENSRSFKSLVSWVGFNCVEVEYERDVRFAGESKWGFFSLADLAIESAMSVSRKPIRWFSYVASAAFVTCFLLWLASLLVGEGSIGYAACMLISGVAVGLGIVGEYVGVVFDEVKGRPQYFVSTVVEDHARTYSEKSTIQADMPKHGVVGEC